MKHPSYIPFFTPSKEETLDESMENIDEETVGEIIDILNIMHQHGCDDEYTVEETIGKLLELITGKEEVDIKCNDVVIKVKKKDYGFDVDIEPSNTFTSF